MAAIPVPDVPDPRQWPAAAGEPWKAMQAAQDAATTAEADAHDARARAWLAACVAHGDGERLAAVLARAPSYALARHALRLLADVERDAQPAAALRTLVFAVPVVLVVALDAGAAPVTLAGVLRETAAIADRLRRARAFGGAETFALASSLVAATDLDVVAVPALLARAALRDAGSQATADPIDLPPAPIRVDARDPRVHLRFLVGALLAPPHADPLRHPTLGHEALPLAQALAGALAAPGVSLLALPRPPQRLVPAVLAGRAAQREVSLQVFASNAIRRLRAAYGEPTAIVSAHRAADATGGGELRLSLSSPFAPQAAEGFRCPLYAGESVRDVAAMLDALLRDCRVGDVQAIAGVHADVDAASGRPLFFKDVQEPPLH